MKEEGVMKRRKRTGIISMLFLGIALILSGCGGGGGGGGGISDYTIGGTVSGLSGTVVLQNNGGDDLTITADGAFTFSTALTDGAGYNVQVSQQPKTQTCTASSNSGTISGANVTDVVVTCASITISGTVVYSPDSNSDTPLPGITVEARNPSDDSVITTAATDANGAYSLSVPVTRDFYLHATGKTIGSTTYVSENLQIENEAADKTVNFWVIDTGTLNPVAGSLGIDTTNDAIFAMDVEDSSNGIAGVTVAAVPAVTNIWYNQDGNGTFSLTPPTTVNNGPSVVGNVSNPGSNGTYMFTMTGSTSIIIDNPVTLRLIPGEISEPIEP